LSRSWNESWRRSDAQDAQVAHAAAIFGAVIAIRAENANLAEFGIQAGPVPFSLGESAL